MAKGVIALLVALPGSASAQLAPPAPPSIAFGEWEATPIVELRPRGEYRHDLDDRDYGVLAERARLGLDVLRGPCRGQGGPGGRADPRSRRHARPDRWAGLDRLHRRV
jgi:hypothetical protein